MTVYPKLGYCLACKANVRLWSGFLGEWFCSLCNGFVMTANGDTKDPA